jgi:hypothetical protein|tara:strand:+ start:602 stop:751 length:150 start_codon:yes stop_codon:yes gene_type:complete
MHKILEKLRALKTQILERKQKTKRLRIKGMGVIIINENGSHANLSKWKN